MPSRSRRFARTSAALARETSIWSSGLSPPHPPLQGDERCVERRVERHRAVRRQGGAVRHSVPVQARVDADAVERRKGRRANLSHQCARALDPPGQPAWPRGSERVPAAGRRRVSCARCRSRRRGPSWPLVSECRRRLRGREGWGARPMRTDSPSTRPSRRRRSNVHSGRPRQPPSGAAGCAMTTTAIPSTMHRWGRR